MMDRQTTGRTAEQIAAAYLQANGFTILHVNWRQGAKELDIVAEKERRLHVVEVRSLSSTYFTAPQQTISKTKRRNLIAAADAYVQRYKLTMEVQMDVIAVVFQRAAYTLEYIPCAFYPEL